MKKISQFIKENESDIKTETKKLVEYVIYTAKDIKQHNDIPYMCCGAVRIQTLFAYLKKAPEDYVRKLCRSYSTKLVDFLDKYGLEEFRKLAGKISNAQKKQNIEVGWKYLFIGRYLSKEWGNDQEIKAENSAIRQVLEQMFKTDDFDTWAKSLKYDPEHNCVRCADKYDLDDVYAEKGETKSNNYISTSARASVFSTTTGYTVYVNGKPYNTSMYKSEASRI